MRRRQLHDPYFKKAKAEGYLARSAYKLAEINDRHRVFGPGDRVLDLGCAPGAWLQVASEVVGRPPRGPRGAGRRGRVVGLDLCETRHDFGPSVRTIVGDVNQIEPALLIEAGGGAFDAVVSDVAPSTTGAGDHFLSVRLCRRVLEMLPSLLRAEGNLAMKVFEGEEYPALVNETRRLFASVRGFKPKASREMSREMYIIGHGFRPGPSASE